MFRLLLFCLIILLPADNDLTGSIPSEIGWMTSLSILYLSKFACFSIRSSSETTLTHMSRLLLSCVIVLLAFNGLSGSIPGEIGNLPGITALYLSKLLEKFATKPTIACMAIVP
jgi:hypothetical protein